MQESPSQLSQTPPVPATAEALCRAWYEAYGKAVYSYVRFHLASADLALEL